MKELAVEMLLGAAVLSAWLGCYGFVRFKTALDRLHCAAFVNVAAGFAITLAVLVQDGATDRLLKMIAVWAVLPLAGAATSHAIGRALVLRDGAGR
ncbi:MAG TPA: monovalent cation/H(+) antiporter subunit G [Stellaceae bacterium]